MKKNLDHKNSQLTKNRMGHHLFQNRNHSYYRIIQEHKYENILYNIQPNQKPPTPQKNSK
jgi:hypothetical protein